MVKYHVNPKTGEPGLCGAQANNCPFGGGDVHYPTKEAARSAYEKTMAAPAFNFKPHLTAISRKTASYPAKNFVGGHLRQLVDSGKPSRLLDYGCGRGTDVEFYRSFGGGEVYGYDPHWAPAEPEGQFNVVAMSYVLNVVESKEKRLEVLKKASASLAPGGEMFVSVRSHSTIEKEAAKNGWTPRGDGYITSLQRGTFQKGLTEEELQQLGAEAGLTDLKLIKHPDALTLSGTKIS